MCHCSGSVLPLVMFCFWGLMLTFPKKKISEKISKGDGERGRESPSWFHWSGWKGWLDLVLLFVAMNEYDDKDDEDDDADDDNDADDYDADDDVHCSWWRHKQWFWWSVQLDNSKLGLTQQQKICWHWHVTRIISSQKIYGLYGLKHNIVEKRGDVTMRDGRTNEQLKIELLSQWKLEAESRNY